MGKLTIDVRDHDHQKQIQRKAIYLRHNGFPHLQIEPEKLPLSEPPCKVQLDTRDETSVEELQRAFDDAEPRKW